MLDIIKKKIENAEFENAYELLNQYLSTNQIYTDSISILESSIYIGLNDIDNAISSIMKGLEINPINYELYFLLGNVYSEMNLFAKAYLCYENAIFHARNHKEDLKFLSSYFNNFCTETNTKLPKVSIIILTLNNLDYTKCCIQSIHDFCIPSSYEIIIVDNGSTDTTREYLSALPNIKYHFSEKNLGFAGGCNVGIHLAEPDNDIFLLNNDTILTENALFELRMGLYENEQIGAAGALSNNAGRNQVISESFTSLEEYMEYGFKNNIPSPNALAYQTLLIGFALLIKNTAYKKTGDLDEQFFPGNFEDNDYCTRLILNNYKLALCKNSFIFHFGNISFKSLNEEKTYDFGTNYLENQEKYINKWHIRPDYSLSYRPEIIEQITLKDTSKPINVLDIGCACGSTLLEIKNRYPNASLYGIELDKHCAEFASHIAHVVTGNIETIAFPFDISFDYIILGDVLEHLAEPQKLLEKLRNHLAPTGEIITSIPNILHYSAIMQILMGSFAYTNSGVLDRTHLRFFTMYDSVKLLENSGYQITGFSKNYKHPDPTDKELNQFLEDLSHVPKVVDKDHFHVIQYVFKASPITF